MHHEVERIMLVCLIGGPTFEPVLNSYGATGRITP